MSLVFTVEVLHTLKPKQTAPGTPVVGYRWSNIDSAWSEHFRDGIWSLPWRRELVMVFVALDKAEYQVPDIEGPTPHPMAVVPA